MLLDAKYRVIASSDGKGVLTDVFPLRTEGRSRGFYIDGSRTVSFALTPGYETYEGMGWFGVIEYRSETAVSSMRH